MVGFPGIDIHSPDSAALDLLDEACSDFGSRLFPLVPKVSAALWERWSPRDSVSHWTHDDLELGPHTHPPVTNFRNSLPTANRRTLGVADGGGFEPPLPCGKHAFQACAIDHSATHPSADFQPTLLRLRESAGGIVA